MIMAWGWLWLWSMPLVSDAIRGSLEARHPFRLAVEYPQADVIVILGGGVEGAAQGGRAMPHLVAGADREWFGAQLYHARKAPYLLVSAGPSPGRHTESGADGMAIFLQALGVPKEALWLEPLARNTKENALLVQQILADMGAKHILLVTSAYHMPRALRMFSGSLLDITPAPTDHGVVKADFDLLRLFPQSGSLSQSTDAIREYLGIWLDMLKKCTRHRLG